MTLKLQHIILFSVILVFIAFFFTALFSGFSFLGKSPKINEVVPPMSSPGDLIELRGEHFGDERKQSKVIIAGQPLSGSNIYSWSDSLIQLYLPDFNRSTFISVKTRSGESTGRIISSSRDFPQILYDPFLPGVPFIEYIENAYGKSGSVVDLIGRNFASFQGSREILVNKKPGYELQLFDEPDSDAFLSVPSEYILLWSDSHIRFILPEGGQSGPMILKSPAGFSNPQYYEMENVSDKYLLGESRVYNLQRNFSIFHISAYPSNQLVVNTPLPAESPWQNTRLLSLNEKLMDVSIWDDSSYPMIFSNLCPGDDPEFSVQERVEVYEVQSVPDLDLISSRYNPDHPEVAAYTVSENDLPSSSKRFIGIARSVTRGSSHPYNRTRKIFQYVVSRLAFNAENHYGAEQALDARSGDARSYVLLFCTLARADGIPARPVKGVLLDKDVPRIHWWAEVYFEGFGWFPLDPSCGDGMVVEGSSLKAEDYWGGLDNLRVAYSRGKLKSDSSQPDNRTFSVESYSNQSIYMETSGHFLYLASHWDPPVLQQ